MTQEGQKLRRSVIKEEFIKLTDNLTAAVILNQLLYWTDKVKDFDKLLTEIQNNQDPQKEKLPLLHGWIYKSSEELTKETLLHCSNDTILRGVTLLIEKRYIEKRANPDIKWDKTSQYRVNLLFINQELKKHGFNGLEGYKFSDKITTMEDGIIVTQNVSSITQNASSNQAKCDSNNIDCNKDSFKETFSKEKVCALRAKETSGAVVNRTRSKTKDFVPSLQNPTIVMPEESKNVYTAIVDHWNSKKGLVKHKGGTKRYDEIIRLLHKFSTGAFFATQEQFKGKKFKRKDFVKSIDQFALAATHPGYEAAEGSSYKEYLRKMPFNIFIYNSHSQNGDQSLFLKYFENDAKLLTDKYLKDENPELTQAIMDEYQRQQLGTKDEIKSKGPFVKAAKRLGAFLEANKTRLMPGRDLSDENIARWLVTAVTNASRGKAVPAAFLASDLTYEQILPIFFQNEAIFKQTNKEKTSSYKHIPSEEEGMRQMLYDEERTPRYRTVID